ncbi:NYN domain-containing protein [Rubrivivax sp. JA1024]|nr:NYN domain-containing protein [Rubrivivax sp. JA1024]
MNTGVMLLIDADNVSLDVMEQAVELMIERHGALHVRRAYCTAESALKHQAAFKRLGIKPMVNLAAGKNSTDIAMAVDAIDLVLALRPAVVAIASSDSDFAPLVQRLREKGCRVVGLGQDGKTGDETISVYDEFTVLSHRRGGVAKTPSRGRAGRTGTSSRAAADGGARTAARGSARREPPAPQRPAPAAAPAPLVDAAPAEPALAPAAEAAPATEAATPERAPRRRRGRRDAEAAVPAVADTSAAPAPAPVPEPAAAEPVPSAADEPVAEVPAAEAPAPRRAPRRRKTVEPAAEPAGEPAAAAAPASAPEPAPKPAPRPPRAAPAPAAAYPDEIRQILAALPELLRGDAVELRLAAERLRDAELLGPRASSTRFFAPHAERFELLPAGQPNKVRLRPIEG